MTEPTSQSSNGRINALSESRALAAAGRIAAIVGTFSGLGLGGAAVYFLTDIHRDFKKLVERVDGIAGHVIAEQVQGNVMRAEVGKLRTRADRVEMEIRGLDGRIIRLESRGQYLQQGPIP